MRKKQLKPDRRIKTTAERKAMLIVGERHGHRIWLTSYFNTPTPRKRDFVHFDANDLPEHPFDAQIFINDRFCDCMYPRPPDHFVTEKMLKLAVELVADFKTKASRTP